MTTKMQSCIDHIKTSTDVDPWAMEMVKQIFTEYDKRFDKVLEIIAELKNENIGRDGSDEYTSACQDFRAAVMELKGGEQE